MRRRKHALLSAVLFLLILPLFAAVPITAQDPENAQLLNPPPDSWPHYHGDYSAPSHPPHPNPTAECDDLTLAWAFQTNQAAQIKSSRCWLMGSCTSWCRKTFGQSTPTLGTWFGITRATALQVLTRKGFFIVDAHPSWSLYVAKPADGVYGWAGADYDVWGKGVIEAIDYQTGKIRWTPEAGAGGSGAGVMTTYSGLTITGDGYGNVLVLDTSNGNTLWHAWMGSPMESSPISYELDGRQYIMSISGGVLFAWALPKGKIGRNAIDMQHI